MFGFGKFGGFSFPTRQAFGSAEPFSNQVQSDQEFQQAWQNRINETPQMIEGFQSYVPGTDGFNADLANTVRQDAQARFSNDWTSWMNKNSDADRPALQAAWDQAQALGLTLTPTRNADGSTTVELVDTPYTDAGMERFTAMGGGPMQIRTFTPNPEWDRINAEFQKESALRTENQTRQQQAYDTIMNGDGFIGGVINESYTNPMSGQITGTPATAGGLGGFGGFGGDLTGIAPDTRGAYQGSGGLYRPNSDQTDPFRLGLFGRSA